MKKTAIYSRAARRDNSPAPGAAMPPLPEASASSPCPEDTGTNRTPHPGDPVPAPSSREGVPPVPLTQQLRRSLHTHPVTWLLALALLGVSLFAISGRWAPSSPPQDLSPAALQAINAEVRRSLTQHPLPSAVAQAYERIAPSVVRVSGLSGTGETGGSGGLAEGIGTGVVIVDNGTILTNYHVVQRAKRIKVMFHDGEESPAEVVSVDAANDLAVLRAKSIPDDLQAATLRSTADLRPGDQVLTVGFPFGIGPSVSSGVVSGLQREYRSPDGQQVISNLIQFDAAANPGNSGGPLLTLEGEVVGIVTAILNPAQQRVFIGIGFAVPIENAASGVGLTPF